MGLFISVSPALLQAIEMYWLALVTVTMINKQQRKPGSQLALFEGGCEGDMSTCWPHRVVSWDWVEAGVILEHCGDKPNHSLCVIKLS